MNISEMTLEQLQDFALQQQEQISTLKGENATLTGKIGELAELNTALQKRNNDLFMRVEQQVTPTGDTPAETPTPTETCEDFARNLIKRSKQQ